MSAAIMDLSPYPESKDGRGVTNRAIGASGHVPTSVGPSTTISGRSWYRDTLLRLNYVASLGANWDGRGSAAVSAETAIFALTVLAQVLPPDVEAPSIIPLGHGGIQLEWSDDQQEIELDVVKPNRIVVYFFNKSNGLEEEFTATTDYTRLAQLFWSRHLTDRIRNRTYAIYARPSAS